MCISLLITVKKVVCTALKIPPEENNENTVGVWMESIATSC